VAYGGHTDPQGGASEEAAWCVFEDIFRLWDKDHGSMVSLTSLGLLVAGHKGSNIPRKAVAPTNTPVPNSFVKPFFEKNNNIKALISKAARDNLLFRSCTVSVLGDTSDSAPGLVPATATVDWTRIHLFWILQDHDWADVVNAFHPTMVKAGDVVIRQGKKRPSHVTGLERLR
jgi:hypothetical protein